eukprot:12889483-Prorocentrum_lima.AAC.1
MIEWTASINNSTREIIIQRTNTPMHGGVCQAVPDTTAYQGKSNHQDLEGKESNGDMWKLCPRT